jgi:DNA-binding NarL/FixJ family response regulator
MARQFFAEFRHNGGGQSMARIRILIADDHQLVLAGLKTLVRDDPSIEVIGEAADGPSALRSAIELKPDVVVLDLSMPGMTGIRVAQALRVQLPNCQIVVLSIHEDRAYLRRLLELGISGYVLKRSAPQELIGAIRAVIAGGTYLDPAIAGMIVGRGNHSGSARSIDSPNELSARETEVLQLAAAGYTNKEVSVQLSVGVKTIETHKARAMEKLGLDTRAELVRYAIVKGWLAGP